MKIRAMLLFLLCALSGIPAMAGADFDVFVGRMEFDQADGVWAFGLRGAVPVTAALAVDLGATVVEPVTLDSSSGFAGELDAVPLDLGLRYSFANGLYVGAGFSYILLWGDNAKIDDATGAFGRIGYAHAVTSYLSIFGEAIYRDANTKLDGYSVDLSGPAANIGVRTRF